MDAKVPETNLVAYTLNGLSEKYRYIATTIRHRDPLPSFWDTRSMLTLEETQMLQDQNRYSSMTHTDHSSAPTILAAESSNSQHQRGGFRGNRGGSRNFRGGRGGGRSGGRQWHNSNQQPSNGSGGPHQRSSTQQGSWVYGWYQIPSQGTVQAGLLPTPPVHNNF